MTGLAGAGWFVGATLLAALLAAVGFALRRTAPPIARWSGFVVGVGFVVIALLAPRPLQVGVAPHVSTASFAAMPHGSDAALLAAAARSGPRAAELRLQWAPEVRDMLLANAPPRAALGAVAAAPPPLPFEPGALRLRCVGEGAVGRPLPLELAWAPSCAPASWPSTPIELQVRTAGDERVALRQAVVLRDSASAVSFVPTAAGPHTVELRCAVPGHTVVWRGAFDVAPADEVLVVENGDVVAAALRAQGMRVRAVSTLPGAGAGAEVGADRPAGPAGAARTVVLAAPVPFAAQQALAAALTDGLGLFVLAPAFGDERAPLREVLPMRPLPLAADSGETAAGAAGERTTPPPAVAPPNVEPPRNQAIGETGEHRPVSSEPIEVDKHAIAMVLVVDRSGSMGTRLANGLTKMSYAKTSALRTAMALAAGDTVGIVTFGNKNAGRVELPMTDAADLHTVRAGIDKLGYAQEYTYLLSGLRLARQLLADQQAAVKHVVIVTDGEFVLDEGIGLSAEARHMCSDDHVTVSMVSIVDSGTDRSFLHEAGELTKAGGGEFRTLTDPAQVPSMVSAEVTRALSKVGRKPRGDDRDGDETAPPDQVTPPPAPPELPPPPPPPESPVEHTTLPVHAVAQTPLLAPDPGEWPRVAGLLRCEAPLDTRVLLVAGDDGWPLLAYANRGLGRVGALAIDVARDDVPLCQAPAFPAWLAQWVRAVAPSSRAAEAREVAFAIDVTPPAPTAHDLQWLAAVSGAAVGDEPAAAGPVTGAATVPQLAAHAGWLLLALVLLAAVERAAIGWAARHGRAG